MASFYFPFRMTVDNIPLIVYPCVGIETIFDRTIPDLLEGQVRKVYAHNKALIRGQYHILILWNNDGEIMTDVWIFDKIESWGSGPLIDIKVFRNVAPEVTIGLSAGDGVIMIGRETEQEELLRKSGKSLHEYLTNARPELPIEIAPQEEFYL